jgi:periplasmic divalent cation tolerance protein
MELARALVTERLAACVNVCAPVNQCITGRDKSKLHRGSVAIKTRSALYPRRGGHPASHPYELPDIVAVPLSDGLRPYFAWLDSETAA